MGKIDWLELEMRQREILRAFAAGTMPATEALFRLDEVIAAHSGRGCSLGPAPADLAHVQAEEWDRAAGKDPRTHTRVPAHAAMAYMSKDDLYFLFDECKRRAELLEKAIAGYVTSSRDLDARGEDDAAKVQALAADRLRARLDRARLMAGKLNHLLMELP